MKRIYLLVMTLLLSLTNGFAATWYSNPTGGDASLFTGWWSANDGTGTHPTSFATTGDVWVIQSSMTFNQATWDLGGSLSVTGGSLIGSVGTTYNIGGDLNMSSSGYIDQSSGNLSIYLQGNLNMSGTSYISNTPALTSVRFANTSSTIASPQVFTNTSTSENSSNAALVVDSNCVVQLGTTASWPNSPFIVYGKLDCQNNAFSGDESFLMIENGATLLTMNAQGLDGAVTADYGYDNFSSSANYVFNGTTAQTTGYNLPTTLFAPDTLTINNAAGVTLTELLSTTGKILLANGILSTGGSNLTTPGAANAVLNAGPTNYINGSLTKTINGLTTVNFEIGDADYVPLKLTLDQAIDSAAAKITVKATNGLHPQIATSAAITTNVVNHYWTINTAGVPNTATVTPEFTYNATDVVGGSNSAFEIQNYANSVWGSPMAATNTSTPYTSTANNGVNITGLSADYILCNVVACTAPAAQPTALTLTPGLYSIAGSFTAASTAPDNYMVIMTATNTPPITPVNGTVYPIGDNSLGGTVVSISPSTTFTAPNLPSGLSYWFWIYSDNSLCGGGPLYNTASPLTGGIATTSCSLSGIRTVGPTGNFPTIAAAVTAITDSGLDGPLAIEIQTTYTGETYPIVIGTFPCGSAANTVTIRPQGTLAIVGAPSSEIFDMNGARNVIIDGRVGSTGTTAALSIANNLVASTGAAIRFINDASNDTIRYCNLSASETGTGSGVVVFSTAAVAGNDSDMIEHCDISEGTSTKQPVNGILSNGTSGKENSYNVVSNCNIYDYYSATVASNGVLLNSGNAHWVMDGNKFFQTATRSYITANTHRAIFVNNNNIPGVDFTVTNNIIGHAAADGSGTYTMISNVATTFQAINLSVGILSPSSVQGNIVAGISLFTTSTSGSTGGILCGIDIWNGYLNIGTTTPNIIGGTNPSDRIFANVSSAGGAVMGINSSVNSSLSVVNIANNTVAGLVDSGNLATNAGTVMGITSDGLSTVNITSNNVSNLNAVTNSTSNTAQLAYGIRVTTGGSSTVSNNIISNITNGQTSTAGLTAGILYSGASNGTITNNTISNVTGASANTAVTGQTGVCGIAYTGSLGTGLISDNKIYTIADTNTAAVQSNVSGIAITNSVNPSILANKIYDLRNASTGTTATTPPTVTGILCGKPAPGTVNPTQGALIANNMISLGGNQTNNVEFTGIMHSVTTAGAIVRIYHNSINIEGTVSSGSLPSSCIHIGNNTATPILSVVDIRNNICVNNRSGGSTENYAIANGLNVPSGSTAAWTPNTANYNILNTTNTATVGYWGGDLSFGQWVSTNSQDANSYSGTPVVFTDITQGDLHINMGTTANNIESHGILIPTVLVDYDGDTRPGPGGSTNGGAYAPDLGADEFDGVAIDNLPPIMTYTPLPNTCSTGDATFAATLVDPSGVPAAGSGNEPSVYYKRSSSGTLYSHNATLSSGSLTNGTWSFTITASDMGTLAAGDTVFYYIKSQDDLGNVGTDPAPATPNYYIIGASLNGTYTVGIGGNYSTVTAAASAYNTGCINGSVIFQLTDATYPNETFPITITANPTANATNTLTIEPAPGVAATIANTGGVYANAIFKLLNAAYITMDGINANGSRLTIVDSTASISSTIWLASTPGVGPGCSNITLKNMNLIGAGNTIATNWNVIACIDGAGPSTNGGADNDNITVTGNTFLSSAYGVYASGTAAVSAGGLNNWVVDSNNFGPAAYSTDSNLGRAGIYLQDMVSLTISGNTIQYVGLTSTNAQVVGIFLNTNVDSGSIDHNNINNIQGNTGTYYGTSDIAGIYLGTNAINLNISANNINTIANAPGLFGSHGITVNVNNVSSNLLFENNFISNIVGGSYNSALAQYSWPVGLDLEGTSGNIRIYNNTIAVNSSFASGNTSNDGFAALFVNTSGTGIDVEDNIFEMTYNNVSSLTGEGYAIYSMSPASVFSTIDYNDYYAANENNQLAYISYADVSTIGALQSAFGGNLHSINSKPVFASNTDLHLLNVSQNGVLASGTPLADVPTDIDGTQRSATAPVMGAHEIAVTSCYTVAAGTAHALTPSLCGPGTDSVYVTGNTFATGINFQWESSADSMSWAPIDGATTESYLTSALVTATTYYRVVVTCAFVPGIEDSATTTVVVNPLPTVAVTPNTATYCSGTNSSAALTASGASTYAWSPSLGLSTATGSAVTATPLGTTAYTVTGTDTNGCTNTAIATITVNVTPPPVAVTPAHDTVCSGDTIVLSGVSALPDTVMLMDFNTDLGNWTVDNTGSTNSTLYAPWQLLPNGYTSPGFGDVFNSPDNTQFIGANAGYNFSNGTDISHLISPSFSLVGYSSASVSFQQVYENGTDFNIEVDASVDNGTTWTQVQNDLGQAIGMPNSFQLSTIDLTGYVGQPNVMLRWWYQANNGFWGIDNVLVLGSGNYTNSITWSPATGLYTDAGLTTPYTGTPTNLVYTAPSVSTQTIYTYTATATNGTCTDTGTSTIVVGPSIIAETVTGGGAICPNGTGADVSLSGSTVGTTYQLYNSAGSIGSLVAGTGNTIDFGLQTAAGSYHVSANNGICTIDMFDSAVITLNPLPVVGNITGVESLCVGSTLTLADTTVSGVWSSVSTSVATITSDGVVTAVAPGTDTIKYTTPANSCGTSTADTVITVNSVPVVASITGANSLCAGSSLTLADVTSGGVWSSVSTSIATITNDGVVTAVAAGADTIKYTGATNSCGTGNADTVITVNASPVPAITEASGVLSTGTYSTYQWSTGGQPISGATDATYTATQNGTYTVTVTDANGCSGMATITVSDLGITRLNSSMVVSLYPNPNLGTFSLTGSIIAANGKAHLEVTDASGKKVFTDDLRINNNTLNHEVKMADNLAAGIYFVKVISDQQTIVIPFSKM